MELVPTLITVGYVAFDPAPTAREDVVPAPYHTRDVVGYVSFHDRPLVFDALLLSFQNSASFGALPCWLVMVTCPALVAPLAPVMVPVITSSGPLDPPVTQ